MKKFLIGAALISVGYAAGYLVGTVTMTIGTSLICYDVKNKDESAIAMMEKMENFGERLRNLT